MRIGLFDSGIGGLTVLKKLVHKYPNHEYIYFGDNKNLPYGEKNKDTLLKLAQNNIKFLESKNVDLIIIACGTISSTCYKELKEKTNIKMFSIITPTNLYLENSSYENILVLATTATVKTKIFSNYLINKNVLEYSCSSFVPMIENNDINIDIIKKELEELSEKQFDVVVLGCTHFPLIKKELKEVINTNYIDMSDFITIDGFESNKRITLYFSNLTDRVINNVNNILAEYNEIFEYNEQ